LIGEHTDYNDGFVLPMAINRSTYVVGRFNRLQRFRILSANVNDQKGSHDSNKTKTCFVGI